MEHPGEWEEIKSEVIQALGEEEGTKTLFLMLEGKFRAAHYVLNRLNTFLEKRTMDLSVRNLDLFMIHKDVEVALRCLKIHPFELQSIEDQMYQYQHSIEVKRAEITTA